MPLVPYPRKHGLPLAMTAIRHLERWCISEALAVEDVLGSEARIVVKLRQEASYLRNVLLMLEEDALADAAVHEGI
jgi:hypothetical protein